MARTFSAVVTLGSERLGEVGPFAVSPEWWAEVGPVVAGLEEVLGVPVTVLRLLDVVGGDGARDGHVRYQVEASARPAIALRPTAFPVADEPLRLPWATAAGVAELLGWASSHVRLTGRPVQHKTWNLAGLWRLPVAGGHAWLKATPPFAADEAAAIAVLASVDPDLVPGVLASAPGRVLLADVPGEDLWQATDAQVETTVRRFVAAQAAVTVRGGLRVRTSEVLAAQVEAVLGRLDLTDEERKRVRALAPRWSALDGCGLPDTFVHGDFHPGNWRGTRILDFADACWGNPVQDGLRAIDYLPPERRDTARRVWVSAWEQAAPGSRPAEALRLAEPLAHLAYAVRYQEFLDNIEPSERIYHAGDPEAVIRHALAC
ncbi:aminoglycoside phosphotransferase family protein [Cryptosporangium arvum]|uniref:Putative homoserine kinase type II (Protein kinase fold) n=1 Tax=Cryptosporangium arvum DSM 44712 TaxID=927661 RepID=A0A010ZUD3_9ACTN|nr:aminoglycoside phosphotransferase family protein [Cryptosporangium arvum]EXG80802.1 putative homoserine kinase type II (protein kinase fold) [Cryptosporangium arvum DSM 44712]